MFLLWVILERIYSLVEFFPCFLFFVFRFTCKGNKCVKQLDCIQQKTTTNFFFSQVLSIFLSITMFMSVCLCNVYVCQYRLIWQKAFFVVVDNETHKRHWFRHLRLFFCWDKNFFLFCFSLIFFYYYWKRVKSLVFVDRIKTYTLMILSSFFVGTMKMENELTYKNSFPFYFSLLMIKTSSYFEFFFVSCFLFYYRLEFFFSVVVAVAIIFFFFVNPYFIIIGYIKEWHLLK